MGMFGQNLDTVLKYHNSPLLLVWVP